MKEKTLAICDRLFAVVGAFLFVQVPQFYQQYTLVLSGHLSELSFQIAQIERSAKTTDKTLNQLIQKFLSSQDPDFHNQGLFLQTLFERWTLFTQAISAFQESTLISRPFTFIRYFDWQICKETLHQFTVGFSLTLESLIYAIVGIFFGYLLFLMIAKAFSLQK